MGGQVAQGSSNVGAGDFAATDFRDQPQAGSDFFSDPFTSGVPNSGSVWDTADPFFGDPSPSNVTGGPADPVYTAQAQATRSELDEASQQRQDEQQQQKEQQPSSAAGGARQKQQGPLGQLSTGLQQLSKLLSGQKPQGASFIAPEKPQFGGGQAPQTPQTPSATVSGAGQPQQAAFHPQAGTQGGGPPVQASPPTAQAAPPPVASQPETPQPSMAQQASLGAGLPGPMQNFSPGLAGVAQAAMAAPPTSPTSAPAAAPNTGAGPGAAPTQAATGAAPDPQLMAIRGDPTQATWENRVPAAPTSTSAPPGAQAPTQQDVSVSRLAGTTTAPTAGFSPVLAQDRAPYARELDNPRTALKVATMMSFESSRDPIAVAESLQNRTKYANSTIDRMVSPAFYGPMRKPRMWNRRMNELARNPQQVKRYLDAFRTAAAGTNLLGGATDQGSGRDPNVRHRGGRVIRYGETYNDWGGGPGGHSGAQRFREEQQRRVRAGGGQASAEAPTQVAANTPVPGETQRPGNPFPGNVGTGAGRFPQGPVLNTIERLKQQRDRDQGIDRRGESQPVRVAEARPRTPMPRARPGEAGIYGEGEGVPEGYRDYTNPYIPDFGGKNTGSMKSPGRQMPPPPPAGPGETMDPKEYLRRLNQGGQQSDLLDWLIQQATA